MLYNYMLHKNGEAWRSLGMSSQKQVRLYFVAERILKNSIETVFLTSSYTLFQGNF